jgi:hypothetical protein
MKNCPKAAPIIDFGLDVITDDPCLDDFLQSLQKQFARDETRDAICKRCHELNFLDLFNTPYTDTELHRPAFTRTSSEYGEAIDIAARLGRGDSVEFLSNCPLCKLLLASALRFRPGSWVDLQILRVITPLITTVKLPNRMDAIKTTISEMGDLSKYRRSLFLTARGEHVHVHRLGIRTGISLYSSASNDGEQAYEFSSYLVGERPDYTLIRSWIHACASSHRSCVVDHDTHSLAKIRLVDVYSRMVVPYPADTSPDYVALSYVWGGIRQASVKLEHALTPLPSTIEDALTVVRALGLRYLWVDSLCIDQESDEHKLSQISVMASIYRSAHVTIINLTGNSALSGLPGVGTDRTIPQFRCTLGQSTTLISTLPALAAYARQSHWSSRAWVFQEALLSSRKLFFTQSQVYFECGAHQTSEILRSHLPTALLPQNSSASRHLLIDPERPQGEFRIDLSILPCYGPIHLPSRRIAIYSALLEEYKSRHLTFFSDSLHGFSAIISALSSGFETEFRFGLPLCDFPFALAWKIAKPAARECTFPSWSWAAYEGSLERGAGTPPSYPDWQLDMDGRPFWRPWIRVGDFLTSTGEYILLGEWQQESDHRDPWDGMTGDLQSLKVETMKFEDTTSNISLQNIRTGFYGPGLLIMEGILLTLKLDGPGWVRYPDVKMATVEFRVSLVGEQKEKVEEDECEEEKQEKKEKKEIYITATTEAHADIIWKKCGQEPREYLMLDRIEYLSGVVYDLLLLEWKGTVAYRVDLVGLFISASRLDDIAQAIPRRRRFWFG